MLAFFTFYIYSYYYRSVYGAVKEKVDYEKSRGSYGQMSMNNSMLAIDDKSSDHVSANSTAARAPQQQVAVYQQGAPGVGLGRPSEGIRGGGQVGNSIH